MPEFSTDFFKTYKEDEEKEKTTPFSTDFFKTYEEEQQFGMRADDTPKGEGYFGRLRRPNGSISTEVSVGVNIYGKEVEIPTLVPTLTKDEVEELLSLNPEDNIPDNIMNKAVAHARFRMGEGKSPFAEEGEQRKLSMGAGDTWSEKKNILRDVVSSVQKANKFAENMARYLPGGDIKGLVTGTNPMQQVMKQTIQDPWGTLKGGFVDVPYSIGLSVAEGAVEGTGNVAHNLDVLSKWIGGDNQGFWKTGGYFEGIAKQAFYYTTKLRETAEEHGRDPLSKVVGKTAGGAVPGITEFMLNVPYYAALGAAEAAERGDSQALGAIVGAAKRFMLGKVLRVLGVLKQPYRSTMMGGVFTGQALTEGATLEEALEAGGSGALYGLVGEKGRKIGPREILQDLMVNNKVVTREQYINKTLNMKELQKVLDDPATNADTKELAKVIIDETGRDHEVAVKYLVKNKEKVDENVLQEYADFYVMDGKTGNIVGRIEGDPAKYKPKDNEVKFWRYKDEDTRTVSSFGKDVDPNKVTDQVAEANLPEIKYGPIEALEIELPAKTEVKPRKYNFIESTSYQGIRKTPQFGPTDNMFVARDKNGKDIGYLWYTKEKGGGFTVRKVEVDKNFQRQGIAKDLYEEVYQKEGQYKGSTARSEEGTQLIKALKKEKPYIFEAPKRNIEESIVQKKSKFQQPTKEKYIAVPEGSSRSELIKTMEKAFDVPIRKGKFKRKVYSPISRSVTERKGIYKTRPEVVRLADANDVTTAAHEVGHHLDKLLGLPKVKSEEVQTLAYGGTKDTSSEGFAEFIRYYITEPDTAKKLAPEFYKDFEQRFLKDAPDVQQSLVKLRLAWNRYHFSSAESKIGSLIRYKVPKKIPTIHDEYRIVVDSINAMQRVKKMAEKKYGRFQPSEDFYALAVINRGSMRKAEQFLKWGTIQIGEEGLIFTGPSFESIIRPIEARGEREAFETYLISKKILSDKRVLKAFERIDFTKADFKEVVDKGYERFDESAMALDNYCDQLLRYMVQAGRLSTESYNNIKTNISFYTPLYRVLEPEAMKKKGGGAGQSYDNVFNPVKRIGERSSSADIFSPLESIMYNTYAMINSAERNRVGEALINLSKREGAGKWVEKVDIPIRPTKVSPKEVGDILKKLDAEVTLDAQLSTAFGLGGDVKKIAKQIAEIIPPEERGVPRTLKELKKLFEDYDIDLDPSVLLPTVDIWRPSYTSIGPNEALFYNRGEPELYQLDPELARAVKGLDMDTMNAWTKFASIPAKWLRAGATLSPDFIARNPFRDQFTAYMYSNYGYKPVVDAVRGAMHILSRSEKWQAFNMSGAAHAALVSLDRDYISKNLRQLLRERSVKDVVKHPIKNGPPLVMELVKNPLKTLQAMSELAEESTRMGEFLKAYAKEGQTWNGLIASGKAAREVTLDFARIGAKTRSWNAITAFWNANVQGLDKLVKEVTENPAKVFSRAFVSITLPSVLLWWAQHDDPAYQEIPTWRKTLFWNWVVHNPDGSVKRIWSLPKPFELGILFGSVPEAVLDKFAKEVPIGPEDMFNELGEILGPQDDIDNQTLRERFMEPHKSQNRLEETFMQLGQSMLPGILPTASVPLVEWLTEKSLFFDRPIVPRGKEDLEKVLQTTSRTSTTAKVISKAFSKIPYLKEAGSPVKLDNLIYGYTGGTGRLATQGLDELIQFFGIMHEPPDPKQTLADIPGVRAFVQRFPSETSYSIEEFYKKYHDEMVKFNSAKERSGTRGKGIEVEQPQFLKDYKATADTLSALRKAARAVEDSPYLDKDEKRKELNFLYIQMVDLARYTLDPNQELIPLPERGAPIPKQLQKKEEKKPTGFTTDFFKTYKEEDGTTIFDGVGL